jgi:hypothetical protein
MSKSPYITFITTTNSLYDRYEADWKLCINSYYGGVEYKNGRYLRAYLGDTNAPGQTISSYITNADGSVVSKVKAKVEYGTSANDTDRGQDLLNGGFYREKLDNTPLYNYVKLITSEYNAILFRNPPQRTLPDTPEVNAFVDDVDGEGNSITEFMSQVDIMTTVYGVCHVSCIKPIGSDVPKWRIHSPLEVTNWQYKYNLDGNLELHKIVIVVEKSDVHTVYRLITPLTIETVFVGKDDSYLPPIDDPSLELVDDYTYRIVQSNELGYIPVQTFYQSTKVYNNIGTTIIQDVAQIQRSIYGDMAEVYAAITYGSHPTLVVDENTAMLNNGEVGAEPGSVIKVQSSLTGESSYTYEFKAPPLDAITEIRELVDNKVQKLSQISMLRSEDLVKAANSGVQLEIYDDKLSALIRRKATNLENGEAKLWDIWFDWLNMIKPEDFSISYNRQYNRRALEIEIKEIDMLMGALERYEAMFGEKESEEEDSETEMEDSEEYANGASCPAATQDVALNLANRQHAIDTANYGPLNPAQPNEDFWQRLADKWGVSVEQAKQSRCGNCAAFVQTSKVLSCIESGLAAGGVTGGEWDTVAAGDLGYCEAFDFKCASSRTCDAWVTGGPITDANAPAMESESEEYSAEERAEEAAEDAEEQEDNKFKTEFRNKIRERLRQLLNSSTTDNGF